MVNLNTFFSGQTDYIEKHNDNGAQIEEELNDLANQVDAFVKGGTPGTIVDYSANMVNRADNARFHFWQRGDGPFSGVGTKTADRWEILEGTVTVQKDAAIKASGDFSMKLSGGPGKVRQVMLKSQIEHLIISRFLTWQALLFTNAASNARLILRVDGTTEYKSDFVDSGSFNEVFVFGSSKNANMTSAELIIEKGASDVWVDEAQVVFGNSGRILFVPQLECIELCNVLSELETGSLCIAGVGAVVGNDRILLTFVSFKQRKTSIPTVTITSPVVTGVAIDVFSRTVDGFCLRVREIGGKGSANGVFLGLVSWIAEV